MIYKSRGNFRLRQHPLSQSFQNLLKTYSHEHTLFRFEIVILYKLIFFHKIIWKEYFPNFGEKGLKTNQSNYYSNLVLNSKKFSANYLLNEFLY